MEKAKDPDIKEKKQRQRSPNYPAVGLREAVERVRKLYEADGKAGAPDKLAAVHIGFASPHGQAMAVVAALKRFGLVEPSNGRLVPTQRAIEIVNLPESDPRRLQALKSAALSPAIYAELVHNHMEMGFPSSDVMQSELVTYKGFNRTAVEGFVRDFKDTLDFAGLSDLSELKSDPEIGGGSDMPQTQATVRQPDTVGAMFSKEIESRSTPGDALVKVGQKMQGAPLLTQTLVVSIPRNFKVEIGVRGDEIKREDLAKIRSQFNRWIEGLEEAFEE